MPLWKTKSLNLTEREVRYAMANSRSNKEASRYLGCSYATYRKYAQMYRDEDTGITLWDMHKNQAGKGLHKESAHEKSYKKADIFDILDGKHPTYNGLRLSTRLIEECIFPEECANCGFSEKRITDYKVPLKLTWKDGDLSNHKKENLEFLCYNCYFLLQGEFTSPGNRLSMNGYY
jgi:hypothetical protein